MSLILDGTLGITNPAGSTTLLNAPTRQVFLSGTAATYTRPTGVRRIVARVKAGGGAGAGTADATSNGGNGTAGNDSIFNSVTAVGGAGGRSGTLVSGTGGVGGNGGTGSSGTASIRIGGGSGAYSGTQYVSATNAQMWGGNGGGQGGGRIPPSTASGGTAVANSGGGGSGATGPSAAFAAIYAYGAAGGGGEGEYLEVVIDSPAATYTYTVGGTAAAGSAGTNGNAGGAGAAGFIIVDEYY